MTIISFEGLGGSLGRWVRRGLLSKFPDVRKIEHVWTDSVNSAYGHDPVIIVGHSFGVRGAVEMARVSRGCKLLLLLDPRMPPWGTGGVVAPDGVRTVCIYQTGFMRGYPVEGAANFQLMGASHIGVPFHDAARSYVQSALDKEK